MPKGTAMRKTGMGTQGYAISSKTKDPTATLQLMQFIFTDGMVVFMENYLTVPPIKSFYDDPAWRDLPARRTTTPSSSAPPRRDDSAPAAVLQHRRLPPGDAGWNRRGAPRPDGAEDAVNNMAEEATRLPAGVTLGDVRVRGGRSLPIAHLAFAAIIRDSSSQRKALDVDARSLPHPMHCGRDTGVAAIWTVPTSAIKEKKDWKAGALGAAFSSVQTWSSF